MTTPGAYRDHVPRERCSRCDASCQARCPRCNRQLCAGHAIPPESLCEDCASYELMRVTRAGSKVLSAAVATGAVAALVAQVAPFLAVLPALACVGILGVGLVGRPLARRRVRRERQLLTVEREAIERQFRAKFELRASVTRLAA